MLQFATTENLQTRDFAANMLRLPQHLFVHDRAGLEIIQVIEIDERVSFLESRVVETALRQTPNERHLPAFEAETNAAAGTRFLAFVAFAAGLAVARAFA